MHVLKEKLETVAQIPHGWVGLFHQLKPRWYHPDRPVHQLGVLTSLENKVKLSWSFSVDAELIHGSFGVCIRVSSQPFLC